MVWIYVKLVLTTLFWGGSFIAAHVAVASLPPVVAAFCRFVIACAGLFILLASTEGLVRPTRQQWKSILGLGLTGIFAYNICFFKGLQLIPASRGALLVALNPSLTALAELLLYRRKLGGGRALGIALSLFGTTLVVTQGDWAHATGGGVGWGELIILGACLSWVSYTLISRRAMTGLSPLANTTYSSLVGALALLPFALQQGLIEHLPAMQAKDWLLAAYLGLPGTVLAFLWYAQGIKAVGAQRTIIFTNLVPVFGVLLSVLLLGEQLTIPTLLGGAITVAGVFLTNRVQR